MNIAVPFIFLLVIALIVGVVVLATIGIDGWLAGIIGAVLLVGVLVFGLFFSYSKVQRMDEAVTITSHNGVIMQKQVHPTWMANSLMRQPQTQTFTSRLARRRAPFIVIMPVTLLAVFGINKWTCRKYEPARG